jgi:hypothetical protein
MATMRGNKLSSVLVLTGALAGGVVASGCGENPVPTNPTYTHDIKQILDARCIRCHGANGTQNADPEVPTFTTPPTLKAMIGPVQPTGDFTTYEGIVKYSGATYTALWHQIMPYMPPPPSDAISGWEFDTLDKWLRETNPPRD